MNSIKNAIVTMTLLAVGYGAYVVLSNPVTDEGAEQGQVDPWAAPEVSTDGAVASDDSSLTPPPVEGTEASSGTTDRQELSATTDAPPVLAPPARDEDDDNSGSNAEEDALVDSSSSEAASSTNGGAEAASEPPSESSSNYYAAQAGASANPSYPSTATPDWPLQGPGNTATSPSDATAPPTTNGDARNATDTHVTSSAAQPSTAPAGDTAFDLAWAEVSSQLKAGKLSEALTGLSAWYGDSSLTSEQRERCQKRLDELAGSVIYSREHLLEPAYVVQAGDTIESLASQYSVSPEFLAQINGVDAPYELFPGESLKVVRGPFRAEVDANAGVITVFLGRSYAGRFAARVGKELPSGDAEYEVAAIEPGREYFDRRSGYRVKATDPQSPYGTHWIGLRGDQITTAHNVGIHVDNPRSEIACIAVSEADAADLAAILSIGSRLAVKH